MTYLWWFWFPWWGFVHCKEMGLLNMILLYANICRICGVSVFALQLWQLLLFWKKPTRKQEGPGTFPHSWPLCVPASAEKPGWCGSDCRQYFHEIGVVLGSLWSQPGYCLGHLLPDREERAVGCSKRLLPALAGLGGTMRPSHSSHASPAHLDFGSEPGQPAKAIRVLLQGLDVEGNPVWWHCCLA